MAGGHNRRNLIEFHPHWMALRALFQSCSQFRLVRCDASSPFVGSWIAEAERRKPGVTICHPIFGFAQRAVMEEIAVVFGTEIIADPRHFCPAIIEKCADSDDNREDEDKGANEELGVRKVVHRVLLVDRVFAAAGGSMAERAAN